MKKLTCVILTVLMTLSLLAGCGAAEEAPGKAPAAVESANDAETTFDIDHPHRHPGCPVCRYRR